MTARGSRTQKQCLAVIDNPPSGRHRRSNGARRRARCPGSAEVRNVARASGSDWYSRVDAHIGSRLRQRRVLTGMSQRDLAASVGVTYQQIRKYELGVNCISSGRLYAIAAALSVPISFFFDGLPATSTAPPAAPSSDGAHDGVALRREAIDLLSAYDTLPDNVRKVVYRLLRSMVRPGDDAVNGYRIYFLGRTGRIDAVHWFEAEDDDAAWWIANRLYGACSDVCAAFELWQGDRNLTAAERANQPSDELEAVVKRRQELLVLHEEALQSSAFRIAESRRLLEEIDRAKRGSHAPG